MYFLLFLSVALFASAPFSLEFPPGHFTANSYAIDAARVYLCLRVISFENLEHRRQTLVPLVYEAIADFYQGYIEIVHLYLRCLRVDVNSMSLPMLTQTSILSSTLRQFLESALQLLDGVANRYAITFPCMQLHPQNDIMLNTVIADRAYANWSDSEIDGTAIMLNFIKALVSQGCDADFSPNSNCGITEVQFKEQIELYNLMCPGANCFIVAGSGMLPAASEDKMAHFYLDIYKCCLKAKLLKLKGNLFSTASCHISVEGASFSGAVAYSQDPAPPKSNASPKIDIQPTQPLNPMNEEQLGTNEEQLGKNEEQLGKVLLS